jgi:diaminopimelate decarboxylase
MKKSKFGIDIKRSAELYKKALSLGNLDVIGVDCHIGSQLTSVGPFVDALSRLREYLDRALAGANIRYLDLGGGLGIQYKDEEPPHPEEYAAALIQGLEGLDLTLILEPGRVMVGNAGILLTEVLYLKETDEKKFVVVDGGMNDLIRPALYGSYQAIQPVVERKAETIVADVVGPICESGDFFAKDREVQRPQPGDLLAVMSAGAYGFTMASNYNAHPKPPEILVNGKDFHVVRKRETFEDLINGESIPAILA